MLKCPLFFFCVHVCDQPQNQRADATRRPDPPCDCSCDPKWPTASPSWCLRLKVLLLIHREEPLALPPLSSSLDVASILSPCVSSCRPAQQRTARSHVKRERRQGIQIVYSAAFQFLNNPHACGVRRVSLVASVVAAALTPAVQNLMTRRELSTQPAFPDFME